MTRGPVFLAQDTPSEQRSGRVRMSIMCLLGRFELLVRTATPVSSSRSAALLLYEQGHFPFPYCNELEGT